MFSCPAAESWGIGDIGDLAHVARWLADARQHVLQLLPLNEMAPGQQSPYSAISAMAIDPIYIRVTDVPEFSAGGGESSLSGADRELLDRVRQSRRVEYGGVRALKNAVLRAAFDRFLDVEWKAGTARALQLRSFVRSQAWWVEDYALFRALHTRHDERPWTEWPEALRRHDEAALAQARLDLERDVTFYQYLQWIASTQWDAARRDARSLGVDLFGDLPFMVDGDSADVWAHQSDFRLDVSVGVPPDAFSETGQDWGMPMYDWVQLEARGFDWLRERARRSAALYDGYRVDHLVGFFRTYGRPRDGSPPFFSPAEEADQIALGERILAIFRESGSEIVAEDLGIVPDFIRTSLARMGIPGFKVMRWERCWNDQGQPFRDPSQYPVVSVAASGTHDTEPLVIWWEDAPREERASVSGLETVRAVSGGDDLTDAAYIPRVRDALLEALTASPAELVLFPIGDIFGWRDRINQPATINDENWSFRLPWPIDRLGEVPEARARQSALRAWAERHARA